MALLCMKLNISTYAELLHVTKIAQGYACAHTGRKSSGYVVAVDCVNTFKTRLDKYWKDQDVMCDWTSEITGTGDRSEYILEST